MTQARARLSSPADVVASVDALLGFHPTPGDAVLIGLREGRWVGLTLRADMPEPVEDRVRGWAHGMAHAMRHGDPLVTTTLLVTYTDDRTLHTALLTALDNFRVDVREALRVHAGRLFCECGDCPPDGTPLPTAPTTAHVAAVTQGLVIAGSREALGERFAWSGDTLTHDDGTETVVGDWRRQVIDVGSRDAAIASLGSLRGDALTLVVEDLLLTLRHTPPWGPKRGHLLGVAAVGAWLRGEGALANLMLDEAAERDESRSLALLLRMALAQAVSPDELRTLIGMLP